MHSKIICLVIEMKKRNVCLVSSNREIIIPATALLYKCYNLFIEHNILNFSNIVKKNYIECLIFYPDDINYFWLELASIQSRFPYLKFVGLLDDNRTDIAHKFGQFEIQDFLPKSKIRNLPQVVKKVLNMNMLEVDFTIFGINEKKCSVVVQKFLRKVKGNYLVLNNIAPIAKSIGVTNSQLSSEMKKYSSFSPKKILMLLKFLHAIHLMQNPGFMLKDISEIIGCKNIRRFNEFTKEIVGLSPRDCKKLCVENKIKIVLKERYNII